MPSRLMPSRLMPSRLMPSRLMPAVLRRTGRRTGLAAAALGVMCVLALSACQSNAINGDNHPTKLAGMSNGRLPASALVTLTSNCRAYKQAAGSLAGLIAAANWHGVRLGTNECYRDYAGQVYQRNVWCARGICANAAIPGTSNHGWGKAVDLNVGGGPITFGSSTYNWLLLNAGRYGFIHPNGVNEPWHWEWVGDGGTMHGAPVKTDLWHWPMTKGTRGEDVLSVQQSIVWWGQRIATDGDYGPQTAGAVATFQAQHHLPVTGIVDLATARALGCFH